MDNDDQLTRQNSDQDARLHDLSCINLLSFIYYNLFYIFLFKIIN